jgi:ABC-2 type transport system ATP-binding protein
MRLELIAALLHKPQVLFLDEPTIGLDILGQEKVRDFIYDYNRKFGATVLLTSHNMEDLLNLSRRVIVINEGRIIFDGALEELVSRFAKKKTITVYLTKEVDLKEVEHIGKVLKVQFPQVILSVPRTTAAVAAAEILQSFPVGDLTIEEESIEEIIGKVFKGESPTKSKK